MKQTVRKEKMDIGRISDNYKEPLQIELNIQDSTVIKYLIGFDEEMREEKALEALRIGVIAIKSESPTLDTKVVEEKFRLFKESRETELKRKLEYIDQDSQRRGRYTTGLRLEERAKAKEDAEWEIKSRKITSAYKIEEIRLKAIRLYPNKEILIP